MKRKAALVILLAALPAVGGLAGAPSAGAAGLERLIAPITVCPDQIDPGAPAATQVRAMHCMTNFARERKGLQPLSDVSVLDRAAQRKAADILRCDDFQHEACGREFTFWMERVGYLRGGCSFAGENIGWGSGSLGSVRSIFTAWIRSPGHRGNILGRDFRDLGVGLRMGNLEGASGAHVWIQQFGTRC